LTLRSKTILVPSGDADLRELIAAESPVPVNVVSNPSHPLGPSDLAVLVVEDVDPPLRAAATRVLTEDVSYVVLVRRDVWNAANDAMNKLLDEVQQDPRRKLIRFWRDRDDLERTLREDVFRLDDYALVEENGAGGPFVKVGTTFEQTWQLENTGFCTWRDRHLREVASDGLEPRADAAPVEETAPGERVTVRMEFTAPTEPASCRSVWQMVDADDRQCFPWAAGIRCQVLAVY
jgi:Ig-like domain from next to BRCA1 gene